jgi:hypothetical protein
VQRGALDLERGIAAAHGVTPGALAAANGIPPDTFVIAGQSLAINLADLIYNDYDADGNSLTASLNSGASYGSLTLNACLVPAVLAGLWTGKHTVDRVPQRVFERLVIGMAVLSAVWLLAVGLHEAYRP